MDQFAHEGSDPWRQESCGGHEFQDSQEESSQLEHPDPNSLSQGSSQEAQETEVEEIQERTHGDESWTETEGNSGELESADQI